MPLLMFYLFFICVLLYADCPGKRRASEGGLAASQLICLHSAIWKRPAPDNGAVNEPTQGEWRIYFMH